MLPIFEAEGSTTLYYTVLSTTQSTTLMTNKLIVYLMVQVDSTEDLLISLVRWVGSQ